MGARFSQFTWGMLDLTDFDEKTKQSYDLRIPRQQQQQQHTAAASGRTL